MKQIYLVGGAVRDMLMGITPKDYDYVAVGYTKEDFSHLKQVGKDFPVFLTEDGDELALARTERSLGNKYTDFSVSTYKVTITEDLMRRDLTINAIAYNQTLDTYIDPYGGAEDVNNKILRHTSDAFVEDPLRVLRLARFRATYQNFTIAEETKELILTMSNSLGALQPDRVWKEVEKVLSLGAKSTAVFFETLQELKVLRYTFPSLFELTKFKEDTKYHREESIFVHTMMVLKELRVNNQETILAALYHDIAKPVAFLLNEGKHCGGHESRELVEPILDLKIPTKILKRVLFIIDGHQKAHKLYELKPTTLTKFLMSFKGDVGLFVNLLYLQKADTLGRNSDEEVEPRAYLDILRALVKIKDYSPKEWLRDNNNATALQIKEYIYKTNLQIVKGLK